MESCWACKGDDDLWKNCGLVGGNNEGNRGDAIHGLPCCGQGIVSSKVCCHGRFIWVPNRDSILIASAAHSMGHWVSMYTLWYTNHACSVHPWFSSHMIEQITFLHLLQKVIWTQAGQIEFKEYVNQTVWYNSWPEVLIMNMQYHVTTSPHCYNTTNEVA